MMESWRERLEPIVHPASINPRLMMLSIFPEKRLQNTAVRDRERTPTLALRREARVMEITI
jgi:hypothetical protein